MGDAETLYAIVGAAVAAGIVGAQVVSKLIDRILGREIKMEEPLKTTPSSEFQQAITRTIAAAINEEHQALQAQITRSHEIQLDTVRELRALSAINEKQNLHLDRISREQAVLLDRTKGGKT